MNLLGSGKSGAGFIRRTIMNLIGFKAKSQRHKQARVVEKTKIKEVDAPLNKLPIYYIYGFYYAPLIESVN